MLAHGSRAGEKDADRNVSWRCDDGVALESEGTKKLANSLVLGDSNTITQSSETIFVLGKSNQIYNHSISRLYLKSSPNG